MSDHVKRKPPPGSALAPPEEDEQLRALQESLSREIALPADAFVIGEPVVVTRLDYGGRRRRGLTACCRREDGTEYVVSLADVRFSEGTAAARGLAGYREWGGR